jgi:hypothetical protein
MSTTPFRTAFWALGLALAMTIILLVPSPQRIRSALRAHRQLPHQRTLLAALPRPNSVTKSSAAKANQARHIERESELDLPPVAAPSDNVSKDSVVETSVSEIPTMESTARSEAPEMPEPVPLPASVRVASADLTAPLGLTGSPTERATATTKAELPNPEEASISIPVPEPVSHSQADSDFPQPEPRLPPPMPRVLAEHMTGPAPAAMATMNTFPPPFPEPSQPPPGEKKALFLQTREHPAEKPSPAEPPPARRYSFQFEATPIAEVLREIGSQAGWSVIVDPTVQGRYTGEFFDADPAQVFALIVKSYNCSVHRRGAFLLIGSRTAEHVH